MTRIIPWTLPSVKGGSIGGYTEHGSGSGGDQPEIGEYYDFSDAALSEGVLYLTMPSMPVTSGNEYDVTSKINGAQFGLEGIVVKELVGVSSVTCEIVSTTTDSGYGQKTQVDAVFNLDPVTRVPSFSYAKDVILTATLTTNASLVAIYRSTTPAGLTSCTLTFKVYNANGQIIQQEEVTLV